MSSRYSATLLAESETPQDALEARVRAPVHLPARDPFTVESRAPLRRFDVPKVLRCPIKLA
jgi:hypothetical protein